ncbi:MAG: type 11 methyltransferase [Amycolatopsis sp.]|jgi:SAM-dependent methyltransferase|uniref:class I SAM-dependent methyltransferase n=1 Tax=Amycolatopsis sp. TaxID=37632 RepID=UPI00261FBC1E|nr:class I SAM-dependent methyltransferase [Amycolatopsis sp.]MCU1682600.1 type 11 methyltransferase [Amycolatopsis sp.]
MTKLKTFEDLLAEGDAVPVDGWDFSWFDGRATEERPSWGYSRLLAERMGVATAALDLQTGGGEVLSGIPKPPKTLFATEGWLPNLAIAERALKPLGGSVVQVANEADLPFDDDTFDLVTSRHPTYIHWDEIARVLRIGGTYLSQGIGAGTNRELYEAIVGPTPDDDSRSPRRAAAAAEAAGLTVVDLRSEALSVEFFDIGAVVHFLRKVLWTVPGFTIERYRPQLERLHHRIEVEGSFVCHSQRYLIDARKREITQH